MATRRATRIRNSLPSPRDRHLMLDLASAIAPAAARRSCEGAHQSRSAVHVQIGELFAQLADLGQVVDDDVHVLGMLREIILVVSLRGIERV